MKSKDKYDSILVSSFDLEGIRRFVDALNTASAPFPAPTENGWEIRIADCRPVQNELHRFAGLWFSSGQNLRTLLDADPKLKSAALNIRVGMMAGPDGSPRLFMLDVGDLSPVDPLHTAMGLFVLFLLNPNRNRLGGACSECGKYYCKKTKRQSVYCSKTCGRKFTSRQANRHRRADEDEKQVRAAKRSIAEFSQRPRRSEWKDWVSKDAQLKKSWLTRAEKRGVISAPKG